MVVELNVVVFDVWEGSFIGRILVGGMKCSGSYVSKYDELVNRVWLLG